MIVHIAMGKERNTFKNSAMIFVYLGFKVLRFTRKSKLIYFVN